MTNKIHTPSELTAKRCQACEGGVEMFTREQAVEQLKQLGDTWALSENGTLISRKWKLKNFVQALELANSIGRLAEEDQHHPDLHITGYRMLKVELTTHAIGGLSENDFILAAKIDQLSPPTVPS
ncbi:MAG: 4a-hydroxytetrahydrobiopterin dehydratase [Pirellulaceae bacterium]|nr:4a-hydroxytetrahydrobiopterin dehydratase [Pirellulaceae bacterium]